MKHRHAVNTSLWFGLCFGLVCALMSACQERADVEREGSAAVVADQVRLRHHFDTVIAELDGADVSHLSVAQRAARAQHIAELARYRVRGVFPHNHDYRDRRMPYFVDEHGTRCALAHLIEESGEGALVERIRSTRNNAYVAELADDRPLLAWLDDAGLSVAEAARIQPAYSCEFFPQPCDDQTEITAPYGTASAIVNVANLTAIVMNIRPASKGRAWFGLISGTLGVSLGVAKLDDAGEVRSLGAINTGLGGLAVLLSGYSLLHQGDGQNAPISADVGGVTIEPVVSTQSVGVRGRF